MRDDKEVGYQVLRAYGALWHTCLAMPVAKSGSGDARRLFHLRPHVVQGTSVRETRQWGLRLFDKSKKSRKLMKIGKSSIPELRTLALI